MSHLWLLGLCTGCLPHSLLDLVTLAYLELYRGRAEYRRITVTMVVEVEVSFEQVHGSWEALLEHR